MDDAVHVFAVFYIVNACVNKGNCVHKSRLCLANMSDTIPTNNLRVRSVQLWFKNSNPLPRKCDIPCMYRTHVLPPTSMCVLETTCILEVNARVASMVSNNCMTRPYSRIRMY